MLEVGANVLPPPTPSARLEINYLHHHVVTFSPEDNSEDPAVALQSLTTAILSNSAGKLNHNSLINRNDNNTSP